MDEDASMRAECRQAFLRLLSRTRNGIPEHVPGIEESGIDVFYDVEETAKQK